jgi:hypothetical protein
VEQRKAQQQVQVQVHLTACCKLRVGGAGQIWQLSCCSVWRMQREGRTAAGGEVLPAAVAVRFLRQRLSARVSGRSSKVVYPQRLADRLAASAVHIGCYCQA